jgi:hypothetical protein
MVQILGDCGTHRVAVKEGDRTTGGSQPAAQFLPQGGFAGTG